ncbi:cytochrome P450 [Mycena floridula]|nr:cytochrome P450 [Mycena floridula]
MAVRELLPSRLEEFLLLAVASLIVMRFLKARKRLPLPPGPPGVPILGNLFDFPLEYDWLIYGKWADAYGSLISLSAFGTNIVVIHSWKLAIELCDKKSPIYSSRPTIPMADIMGWQDAMSSQVYGPRLRSYRKVFHNELGNGAAMKHYWPVEETHARKFIKLCLLNPDRLDHHCFQHAGAIVLRVAYGYIAQESDDPYIKAGNDAMESFNKGCAPGAYMVNQIPILRYLPEWFPGADFKRMARLWRPLFSAMVDLPFNFVKRQMAEGMAESSFTSRWLNKDLSKEDEDILRFAAGSVFAGGSDTTAVVVHAYFLVMTLHNTVQQKLQAEMDAVVGRDRLPTFEDRENLPYLEAFIKEIFRFHIPVPSGIPHCTTADDIHNGYLIPKDSIVICNIWKMSQDPEAYADPATFNPERFLGVSPEQDPREIIFGFGRRLCPGRLLADASIYITIAMCTATLNITPSVENGKVFVPKYQPESGTVSHIRPFKCTITPRSTDVLAMVTE